LLNIRAETGDPALLEYERLINRLVAITLMEQPGVVVCEREDMPELFFEELIAGRQGEGFTTAAYMVDGSFNVTPTGEISLTARLMPKHATPITRVFSGQLDKFQPMAEQIAGFVTESIGAQGARPAKHDRREEASRYFDEAMWAYNCGLSDRAARAAEAAWVLGCDAPSLAPLRIMAYAYLAYPLKPYASSSDKLIDPRQDRRRIDAAIIATELLRNNVDDITKNFTSAPNQNLRWADTINHAILSCSRVLRSYYENDCITLDAEKTAYLRRNLRELYTITLDTSIKQKYGRIIMLTAVAYMPFWMENCEETAQGYEALLKKSVPLAMGPGSGFDTRIPDAMALNRDYGSPYFIDWQGKMTDAERQNVFAAFVERLCRADDPQLKFMGLWFKLRNTYKLYSAEMNDNQAKLNSLVRDIRMDLYNGKACFGTDYLDLDLCATLLEEYLDYALQHPEINMDDGFLQSAQYDTRIEKLYSKSRQKDILSKIDEIHARHGKVYNTLAGIRTRILQVSPDLDVPGGKELTLDHFWQPERQALNNGEKPLYRLWDMKLHRGNIFVLHSDYGNRHNAVSIINLTLKDEQTVTVPERCIDARPIDYEYFDVSEDYIVVGGYHSILMVYKFARDEWQEVNTGEMKCNTITIYGKKAIAYYQIKPEFNQLVESGFLDIDLESGDYRILASSRRKPSMTVLDNTTPFTCSEIFRLDDNTFIFETIDNGSRYYALKDGAFSDIKSMPEAFFRKYLRHVYCIKNDTYLQFTLSDGQPYFAKFWEGKEISPITDLVPRTSLSLVGNAYESLQGAVMGEDFILTTSWIFYDLKSSLGLTVPINITKILSAAKEFTGIFAVHSGKMIIHQDKIYLLLGPVVISFDAAELKASCQRLEKDALSAPQDPPSD
jgi:hypothetical protein